MTRKALVTKCRKKQKRAERQKEAGVKVTLPTRVYSQCVVSGRRRGYIGRFNLSRIELRERINKGEIVGVRKSSW